MKRKIIKIIKILRISIVGLWLAMEVEAGIND